MLISGVAVKPINYRQAGVDLDGYDGLVPLIKGVLAGASESSGGGHFAGMIRLRRRDGDILVASADGVGTKVKVAKACGRYSGLGRDIVAHCTNDILCIGARPVAFLDYIAFDRLDRKAFAEILRGIAGECRRNGIELIGGETAEMPGVYARGECDLAGFIIGLTSRVRLLDGSRIRRGDLLVGLPSNGLHTNGYSLARKVLLEKCGMSLGRRPRGWTEPLGRALLRPHTNYFTSVWPLVGRRLVSGIAHITGGGIAGNLERVLPRRLNALVSRSAWKVPRVFTLIAESGPVSQDEMFRVFNMGLGMVLVVPHRNLPQVMRAAESSRVVGEIVEGEGRVVIS
jgi:phosphoribosylformylglycinamidine cyclo-ligase